MRTMLAVMPARTSGEPAARPAGAGKRLPGALLDEMSARFEYDFSRVRVFDESQAASSAAALGARAFTAGNDIAFASGQYRPWTADGQRLIAHELAHVAQQGGVPAAAAGPQAGLTVSTPGDAAEVAAEDAAARVAAGGNVRVAPLPSGAAAIHRDTSFLERIFGIDEKCHATRRMPGSEHISPWGFLAHIRISQHFQQQFPGAEFEYHIPRSSPRNRSGYVDIAYVPGRALYEIKPLTRIREGDQEVQRYVDRANQYCGGDRLWIRGEGYVGGGPLMEFMGFELYSDLTLSGVITYEWVPGAVIKVASRPATHEPQTDRGSA
jgi:hypothetical protein